MWSLARPRGALLLRPLPRAARGWDREQRRHRVKSKWATTRSKVPNTQAALQLMDATYGLQLGHMWESVRLALLCERKYGALVNAWADSDGTGGELRRLGAVDLVRDVVTRSLAGRDAGEARRVSEPTAERPLDERGRESRGGDGAPCPSDPPDHEGGELGKSLMLESSVLSTLRLSPNIRCFTFPRGDISRFPQPWPAGALRLLSHYLLDAASLLPVLALDVQLGHRVLDLCAAPGGKTLALLQTACCDQLTSNDVSASRTGRLQRVLRTYVPRDAEEAGVPAGGVSVRTRDGIFWLKSAEERGVYDRVLVDAPCTNDRHSLHEEENNIFSRSRMKERQQLPALQTQLLLAGLLACRPGGVVVYSTCSLSQLQNSCVVEAALSLATTNHNVDAQACDLSGMRALFSHAFTFQEEEDRFGETVIPHVAANFGPIYVSKIVRLS
uniref:5-cytosine rRNA methyltransferase NSUN4 n=2 Tax=Petromyzon marinus TaxID=7757 RepID=A0AAJ7X5D3_PETMA|nr:5-methylcytosine rRNA methyltransferase NSUN4 [Petromyzon marinus]